MYTAGDVNLTLPDIYQDYNDWSTYKDNETSNVTDYNFEDAITSIMKMTISLYSIIFVLGIIGNGLVIWIAGFRMKKTISAVWFLNLAVADFLCCGSLLLRIAEWLTRFKGLHFIFCLLNFFMFNINMSSSVLLLTAMSIDRCVSVMWPFWAKFHRTRTLVRITVAIIWILCLTWTGLVFYIYVFHVHDLMEWCMFDYIVRINDDYLQMIKQIIQLLRLVIMFVIPFLIILISYVIIFIRIRKCKRSQRSQRPYRIITAVILGFFICWSPYYIWPLTQRYDDSMYNFQLYIRNSTVTTIVTILACLNSCINPIIYVFMGQDVKLCFFRSIPARLERALTEHPNDLCQEQEDCEIVATTDV